MGQDDDGFVLFHTMLLRFVLVGFVCSAVLTALLFITSPSGRHLRSFGQQEQHLEHIFPHKRRRFETTDRPVVGILTQPNGFGGEYIAASYVKFAEASGARVVPIRYWWSEKELQTVFAGINGVLLPGGGASLDPEDSVMIRPSKILYNLAQKQNKLQPNSFFIFGVCLGWEILAIVASGDGEILKASGQFEDNGVAKSLESVNFKSRLFAGLSPKLTKQRLFYHSHQMGVTPELFKLRLDHKCWDSVALGTDGKGKRFIAAAESKCAPYYGVQFHPEKNLFEWKSGADMPHSLQATETTLHFVRILAQLARQTRRGNFKEAEIFSRAIGHTPVVTTGDGYFFQIYDFGGGNSSDVEPEVRLE